VTSVETVVTAHNDVVTNVVDLVIVALSGLDVEILKVEIPARLSLRTVKPNNSVVGRCSGDVLKGNIVPLEQPCIFAFVLSIEQVGQA
jgi:hypothetical protein